MRRKITVYGLRFSKTSFWNRINTGFSDPAVATVLTVYGIETNEFGTILCCWAHCCNSTYRLRYWNFSVDADGVTVNNLLQQYLPFTVLKLAFNCPNATAATSLLQQYLPFTVLKRHHWPIINNNTNTPVATVLTVYGIETSISFSDIY